MIVNSTDLKNNLGRYLRACVKEEVIITGNGRKIAKLCSYEENRQDKCMIIDDGVIGEEAQAYECLPQRISYEQFRKLTDNNEKRYEYIDGELYLLSAPKVTHQKVLGDLYMLFYNWFKDKKCKPFLSPFNIILKRVPDEINIVEPDLVVICDLEKNLNGNDYYTGIPELALEIISENTRSKDAVKKLDLYMSTGVKEYWLVNPINREITVYFFKDRDISRNMTFKKDENASSYVFRDFSIRLKDIFTG